jgi:hypothetical protein
MSSAWYPYGPQHVTKMLNPDGSPSETWKAALLLNTYTYSAAHYFMSDVASFEATGTGYVRSAVTPVYVGGPLFDDQYGAYDIDFGSIATGETVGSVVVFCVKASAPTDDTQAELVCHYPFAAPVDTATYDPFTVAFVSDWMLRVVAV